MRIVRHAFRALTGVAALAGCDLAPVDCSPLPAIGIAVVVRDSVDGRLLTEGASGVLLAGTFREPMRRGTRGDGGDSVLIGGTGGPYTLRVDHPGYSTWVGRELRGRLTGGICGGIETTIVTARMMR